MLSPSDQSMRIGCIYASISITYSQKNKNKIKSFSAGGELPTDPKKTYAEKERMEGKDKNDAPQILQVKKNQEE